MSWIRDGSVWRGCMSVMLSMKWLVVVSVYIRGGSLPPTMVGAVILSMLLMTDNYLRCRPMFWWLNVWQFVFRVIAELPPEYYEHGSDITQDILNLCG